MSINYKAFMNLMQQKREQTGDPFKTAVPQYVAGSRMEQKTFNEPDENFLGSIKGELAPKVQNSNMPSMPTGITKAHKMRALKSFKLR
jgi:hypothetical protein